MKPAELFASHKNLNEYHETSDGNKFYDKLIAKSHAKTLDDKEVKSVSRKNYEGNKKPAVKITVDQQIESIKALDTIEAIEAALEKQKNKKVLAAGADRIEELNAVVNSNKDAAQEGAE